jgi:hypothetical protein
MVVCIPESVEELKKKVMMGLERSRDYRYKSPGTSRRRELRTKEKPHKQTIRMHQRPNIISWEELVAWAECVVVIYTEARQLPC